MKKICIILLIILPSLPVISQQVTKVGTTAANFLLVGAGARAVGMGSAFVAVSNDITAMYWNPAGITRINQSQAMFSHAKWFADISHNYAGVIVPIQNFGTLGIHASFMNMGTMERTTIAQPDGTGETFTAGSYALGISYARSLTDRFAIGFNGKYLSEQIYHSTARGIAFDIGTLFQTRLNGMNLGMSIANYGTKMRMSGRDMLLQADIDPLIEGNNENLNAYLDTDAYDLPLIFRVGVSMDVLKGIANSNLIISMDALHPNNDKEYMNVGCEYSFQQMVFLRGGYKTLWLTDSQEGLSLGAGLAYRLPTGIALQLDYCYQDFGYLNDIQMFSLIFSF